MAPTAVLSLCSGQLNAVGNLGSELLDAVELLEMAVFNPGFDLAASLATLAQSKLL